jgi:hypothetical protein
MELMREGANRDGHGEPGAVMKNTRKLAKREHSTLNVQPSTFKGFSIHRSPFKKTKRNLP